MNTGRVSADGCWEWVPRVGWVPVPDTVPLEPTTERSLHHVRLINTSSATQWLSQGALEELRAPTERAS